MSILDLFKVDLNTPQPGGRQGESPRSAFTKYNDALDAIAQLVNITSVTEPSPTVPLMTWLDTSVTPPTIRRRNASNNGWVVIGPALDFVYSRSNILGTVSQSGGVPTGSIIERGSNVNGEYVRWADGTQICIKRLTRNIPTTPSDGSWFEETLPASFISRDSTVGYFGVTPTAHNNYELRGTSTTASTCGRRIVQTTQEQGFAVMVFCIGRWQ